MSSVTSVRPSVPEQVEGGAPARAPRRFLPEVQALRALAVTLVVIYHLYPAAAPGGFVGVDVFFVISGFLITSHLLREVTTTGRVSLPKFWAARIRRIMPAAVVTVLAVVAATFLWWPPSQWADISRQAMASLLSMENWVLAADSVDYLAKDNAPTALQHFWSLGVEEQFYVFWPLLVLVAAWVAAWTRRVARRRGAAQVPALGSAVGAHRGLGRRFAAGAAGDGSHRVTGGVSVRKVAGVLFAIVLVISLVYSVALVRGGDPAAYFVTTARVWELAAGGLLAAVLPAAGWAAARPVRVVVALAGLATLIGVAAFYTDETAFPGQGAILPIVGTLAIIAAGRTSGVGSLHPITDWKPVQWVGNASYSLYLWHWPVVIVGTQLLARKFHWWEALGLLALSLVLAAISYHCIETPTRRWKPISKGPWRAVLAGGLATAVALAIAFVPTQRAETVTAEQAAAATALEQDQPTGFGAEAWDTSDGAAFVSGTAIVPAPVMASKDTPAHYACMTPAAGPGVNKCMLGDPHGTKTVALLGDSHAEQWAEAMDRIAKDRHWKLVTYIRTSCPFNTVPRNLEKATHSNCSAANAKTLSTLERDKPDIAVVSSWTGSSYVTDPRPGFADIFKRLQAVGVQPVVLRDTPWYQLKGGKFVKDCVALHPTDPSACDSTPKKAIHTDGAVDAAKAMSGVPVVNPVSWFCSTTSCPAVIGNVLVYRDQNHISNTYALTLDKKLGSALDSALASVKD